MNMKIKNSKTPILSIVTVCFNDYDALIKTFNSVKKQNFTNYEYLVIDGGSKDDTVKFLKKNNEIIDYWVSENDNGIYDVEIYDGRITQKQRINILKINLIY